MVIEKLRLGAHGRETMYAVCADAQETGDTLHEIARFNTLDTAALVLKYMRGDELTRSDELSAKMAISKASVPTDQSKHTRKAE